MGRDGFGSAVLLLLGSPCQVRGAPIGNLMKIVQGYCLGFLFDGTSGKLGGPGNGYINSSM